jgi:hypothetical protein
MYRSAGSLFSHDFADILQVCCVPFSVCFLCARFSPPSHFISRGPIAWRG